MSPPRLLDLFAGEGGSSSGYQRAGFHVTAVDLNRKALDRNPADEKRVADALEYLGELLHWEDPVVSFDAIHASPPCPRFSAATSVSGDRDAHPDYLDELRAMLELSGLPWVIENVPRAPLHNPVTVCGAALGLGVPGYELRRHRLFETNWPLMVPPCQCGNLPPIGVYGGGPTTVQRTDGNGGRPRQANLGEARAAMGMWWASKKGCVDAIPPAYSELVGHQLLQHIRAKEVCGRCHGEGRVMVAGYSVSPFSGVPVCDPQEAHDEPCDICGGTGDARASRRSLASAQTQESVKS